MSRALYSRSLQMNSQSLHPACKHPHLLRFIANGVTCAVSVSAGYPCPAGSDQLLVGVQTMVYQTHQYAEKLYFVFSDQFFTPIPRRLVLLLAERTSV
jgi:hypothetical protein